MTRIRTVMIGVALALALVILAPVLLSSQDLYAWGRTGLGLARAWAWLVPLALDMAAVVCVAMTVVAAWRRERPGVFELLVWVFAGTSAYVQYRHGMTPATRSTAPDAHLAFPAFALLGPVLLHVVLSRVRRWARQDAAEVMTGAAGFGARWLPGVAFRETLAAWAASRREGIDRAADAVAYVREVRALRQLDGVDAVRYAHQATGSTDPYQARVWLQARHRLVDQAALDQATPARSVAARAALPVPAAPVAPPARQDDRTATRAPAPISPAPTGASGPQDASHAAELAALDSKRSAIRYAVAQLGTASAGQVKRWLAQYGIEVARSEAGAVLRQLDQVDTTTGEYPLVVPVDLPRVPRANGHQVAELAEAVAS